MEPELWRAAVESSPFATIVADETGTIALTNRAAETLLGYDRGALVGVNIDALVPEELRSPHAAQRRAFAA